MGEDKDFKELDAEEIANITFYAVKIRYLEGYIEFTIGEAEELYKIARKVRDIVRRKLRENGLRWQN